MGHTPDLNIETYQRPLPIQEIVKVGTRLQAFDQGRSAAYVSVSKIECVISLLDSVQRTNVMMRNAMMLHTLLHLIFSDCSVNFLQTFLGPIPLAFFSLFGLIHLKAFSTVPKRRGRINSQHLIERWNMMVRVWNAKLRGV